MVRIILKDSSDYAKYKLSSAELLIARVLDAYFDSIPDHVKSGFLSLMMNEKGKIGKTEFSVVVDIIRSDLVENYMEEYDFARTFVQIVDEMPNPDDLSDEFYSFLKDMCWRNLSNMNAHIKLQYERTENMYGN